MKFSCMKKDLLKVLTQVSKAVAVKPMTPILSGIYLKEFGGVLEVQANSYTLGMSGQMPVNSKDDGGEVVVLGKKFVEVVKAMPEEVVLIAQNNEYLEVSSGSSSYAVATLNARDFPKVLSPDAAKTFKLNAPALKTAINRTIFACSTDETGHPLYTGCLFDIAGERITIAATDMHRLALAQDTLLNVSEDVRFVIPAVALRTIAGMLPEESAEISVDYTEKYVAFTIDGIFITTRIIEGKFPDYNAVIPKTSAITANFVTSELRQALERISIIAKDATDKKIRLKFESGVLEITATSAQFGEGEEFVPGDVQGGELEICFGIGNIMDALKVMEGYSCRISLNGEFDPAVIREGGNSDYTYVATPQRP